MQMNAYLGFDGTCEAAFRFYETCLGGSIVMLMKWRDSPMAGQAPDGYADKVMHVRLKVGNDILMGSDAPPGRHQPPKGFHVSIIVESPAEADRVFAALLEGGTPTMPIQETFWAQRFGTLVDRFGTPWMVNCEKAA